MRYAEFTLKSVKGSLLDVAVLRLVSPALSMRVDTKAAQRKFKRQCNVVSVKFCRGCQEISRKAHHFGYCMKCKPGRAPEVNRHVMRTVLKLPEEIISQLPWRYSHRGGAKLTRVAHIVDMAESMATKRGKKRKSSAELVDISRPYWN